MGTSRRIILFIFCLFSSSFALASKRTPTEEEDSNNVALFDELKAFFGNSTPDEKIYSLMGMIYPCNSSQLSNIDEERFRRLILDPLKYLKIALIIVDYQNDFVNGSLAVGTGDAQQDPLGALPYINELLENTGVDQVVYTQDWHPYNHISFVEHAKDNDRILVSEFRNRTIAAFDVVQFLQPNITQMVYPSHCVPNTPGVDLYPEMTIAKNAMYIHKGTEVMVDSYSAFKNNNGHLLELDSKLKEQEINAFIACGLAYDICVRYTLVDGSDLGYLAAVSPDCSKGFSTAGIAEAEKTFREKNIAVVSGEETASILARTTVPIEWALALARKIK